MYLPTCAPRTATIYLQTTDVSGCGGWGSSVWAPLVPEPHCPHLRPARNPSALHQHARRVARKRPSRWPVPVGPSVRGPLKSASLLLSKTQGGGLSSPGRCPGSRDRVVQSLRSSAARGFLDAGPPPSDILRGSFQKYMIRTLFPNAAVYKLRGNSAPPAQQRGGSVTAPQEARMSLSAGRKTPEQRRRRRSDGARAEDGARPRLQGPGRGSASPRAGLRGRPSRAGGGRGETRLFVSARQGLGASTTKHERAKTELTAGNPCHRHHRPSAAARAAPRMPPDAARIQDTNMEQRGEPGR